MKCRNLNRKKYCLPICDANVPRRRTISDLNKDLPWTRTRSEFVNNWKDCFKVLSRNRKSNSDFTIYSESNTDVFAQILQFDTSSFWYNIIEEKCNTNVCSYNIIDRLKINKAVATARHVINPPSQLISSPAAIHKRMQYLRMKRKQATCNLKK